MIDSYKLLVKLFVLYLFCILFYNLIPFPATTVLGILIILDLMYIYISNTTRKKLYLLLYLGFIAIYTSIITDDIANNFSDLVRIITVFLLIAMMSNNRELKRLLDALDCDRKLMLRSAQISSLITLAMLFIPYCYAVEASWGENNRYFIGLAPSLHVTASCMCLYLSMYLYGLKGKPFYVIETLFLLPPLIAIFESGARVYLLCVAGFLLLYYYTRLGRKQIKYLLIPLAIVCIGYLLLNSSIVDKFLFTQNGYLPNDFNAVDRFTSGRTVFWMRDISAFLESNIFYKVFGNGFTFIYSVSGHSGHNDVLHMLLGIGLIGSITYVICFVNAIKVAIINLRKSGVNRATTMTFGLMLILYIFVPMILNGIFGYQHLMYSIIILLAYVNSITIGTKNLGDSF